MGVEPELVKAWRNLQKLTVIYCCVSHFALTFIFFIHGVQRCFAKSAFTLINRVAAKSDRRSQNEQVVSSAERRYKYMILLK
jgi:MFS superfamily sulfate permease-like transporter